MNNDMLTSLRDRSRPRDDGISDRVARRIEPTVFFALSAVAYGALISSSIAAALIVGARALGTAWFGASTPGWFIAIAAVVVVVAIWLSFVPFGRWKRRRRRAAAELGRHAVVVDGRAESWTASARGAAYLTISFEQDGAVRRVRSITRTGVARADAEPGRPFPVLYLSGYRFAMYFTTDGAGIPAQVQPPASRPG